MAKKRIALVGLGRMGLRHLRVLRETPGLEVVAMVDADASLPRLRSVRELASVAFDAAVVSTPTRTHREIALELIAMGKDLLVEKPIAPTCAEALELARAAEARGTSLVVGHVERFNPAVRRLGEVMRDGVLGAPVHFAFTRVGGHPERSLGGDNVLLDLAVHDLDVMRSLVGPIGLEHATCHATRSDGVYDAADLGIVAASGATASIRVSWLDSSKLRTIRVTGTRALCLVDYVRQTCELFGQHLEGRRSLEVEAIEPLGAQARAWVELLTSGIPGGLCTARDAMEAVRLAERAAEMDARRGRATAAPASADVIGS